MINYRCSRKAAIANHERKQAPADLQAVTWIVWESHLAQLYDLKTMDIYICI